MELARQIVQSNYFPQEPFRSAGLQQKKPQYDNLKTKQEHFKKLNTYKIMQEGIYPRKLCPLDPSPQLTTLCSSNIALSNTNIKPSKIETNQQNLLKIQEISSRSKELKEQKNISSNKDPNKTDEKVESNFLNPEEQARKAIETNSYRNRNGDSAEIKQDFSIDGNSVKSLSKQGTPETIKRKNKDSSKPEGHFGLSLKKAASPKIESFKSSFNPKIMKCSNRNLVRNLSPDIINKKSVIQNRKSKDKLLYEEEGGTLGSQTQTAAEDLPNINILKANSNDDKEKKNKVYLLKSLFPGRPATLFFTYPKHCLVKRNEERKIQMQGDFKLKFKMTDNVCVYNCVLSALKTAGFTQTEGKNWNLLWSAPLQPEVLKNFSKYQRCNHFPSTWELGHKDNLWKNVSRYIFVLPNVE